MFVWIKWGVFNSPLWINEVLFLRAKTVDSASVSVASDALSEDGVSWLIWFSWFSPIAATEAVFELTVPADNCCCWCWCCWCIGLYGNVYWCDDDDDDGGRYCSPFEFLLLLCTGLSSVSELLTEYVGYSRFLPEMKKNNKFTTNNYKSYRNKSILVWNFSHLTLIS